MIKNPYEFEKRAIVITKYSYENRVIAKANTKTSISMERLYWAIFDHLARKHRTDWQYLVSSVLSNKPSEYNSRAGWLRAYVAAHAYAFLTRPEEIHNPPDQLMQWAYRGKYFKFPRNRSSR